MNKEINGWQVMASNEVLSMYRQNNKNNKNAVGQSYFTYKKNCGLKLENGS